MLCLLGRIVHTKFDIYVFATKVITISVFINNSFNLSLIFYIFIIYIIDTYVYGIIMIYRLHKGQ
jgi:hypothetical protein